MINPPAKKEIVATIEVYCRFDKPEIECPDVHPFAYLVPKPTKKPPKTTNINPFKLISSCQLKMSPGKKALKSFTPMADRS
jgi:hypothetical protein